MVAALGFHLFHKAMCFFFCDVCFSRGRQYAHINNIKELLTPLYIRVSIPVVLSSCGLGLVVWFTV